MTRLEALEAVAAAARVTAREIGATGTLFAALAALDALPAQPQPQPAGEVVKPKTVQIATISPNDGIAACVFALCDDGSIWGKRVDRDDATWWREPTIPATVEPGA